MEKKNNRTKGIALIIISAFFFAWMNAFVHMAGDLPSIQKSFFRNIVAAFFSMGVLAKNHIPIRCRRENIKDMLLRAAFGTMGIICNFYALDKLVLADASMLNKMSPFFAVLFSVFLLREKVKPVQAIIVFGAFAGSMFIVKPSFSNLEFLPSLIGLTGGICAGLAYTLVRRLGQNGEQGAVIVFFFSAFSCAVTLPWLLFNYHPMSLTQLLILLMAGLSAAGGQFSITAAYYCAPAREISVYDYTQLIFASALGFILFAQIPDLLSFIGYGIICLMAVLMFIYTNMTQAGEKPA